jgi:hypothetical protein
MCSLRRGASLSTPSRATTNVTGSPRSPRSCPANQASSEVGVGQVRVVEHVGLIVRTVERGLVVVRFVGVRFVGVFLAGRLTRWG